jgi:hypothetical protein
MKATSARDKKYSHAGIVLFTGVGPIVFHFVGTSDHPDGGLQCDPFSKFCDPGNNFSYAVVRYNLSDREKSSLRCAVISCMKEKKSFDKDFDLTTDDSFYCTEFIYKSYARAVAELPFSVTSTNKGDYIGLDNLYLNPEATIITKTFQP